MSKWLAKNFHNYFQKGLLIKWLNRIAMFTPKGVVRAVSQFQILWRHFDKKNPKRIQGKSLRNSKYHCHLNFQRRYWGNSKKTKKFPNDWIIKCLNFFKMCVSSPKSRKLVRSWERNCRNLPFPPKFGEKLIFLGVLNSDFQLAL